MRYTSLATFAAALMLGGASAAYAQGGQGQGSQQFGQGQGYGTQQFGQGFTGGQQQFGQSGNRFQERASLRRQLRQVGFQNIRILNAAYLVQARTPDGRNVIMVIDPPEMMGGMGQMSQMGPRSGGQMMGRMGQGYGGQMMGQMGQGYGMGQGMGMQGQRMQGQGMQGQGMGMSGSGNQMDSAQNQMGQNQMDMGQSGDSATGSVSASGGLNESQVRSMLQERGLSNIQNLERSGNTFTASADWQGEQIDVRVNATTGEITGPDELS